MFRFYDTTNKLFVENFTINSSGEVMCDGIVLTGILVRYTGLLDKIKKPIFENDLVKFYYKGKMVICQIVFYKGTFCLKWVDGYINHYPLNSDSYQVIGDIFTHEEVFKKQKHEAN